MPEEMKEEPVLTYDLTSPLLDEVNPRILGVLQADPRLTMAELARRVGMSSPAVTERVRRLEEAEVIRGYRLDLDPRAFGLPLSAYVRVRPHSGRLAQIVELARRIPEVVECHRITGDDCFILRVHLPSMEQLDRLLDRFLIYGSTTTSIVQSSPVPARLPPLPQPSKRQE
ncbi:Lrp/AsnC family transcriptional regulator [Deinococcus planocerae]|uniref:Lrp/AsnC family transcriptional regulator n=1 Tax=Deinococcus planocerae TaxID=1737569 RepID=UPI000C7EC99B|nr:Lrp/AsnC family transcriptional regulator [Deinococcus planocerae]